MNRNIRYLTILGLSLLAAVTTISSFNAHKHSEHVTNAEACSHSHVEHYKGSFANGKGQVEHWACCSCHKAWADEDKTIYLGNTLTNRENIEFTTEYAYGNSYYDSDWSWGTSMYPVYDSNRGIMFETSIMAECSKSYVEITAPSSLEANQAYGFAIKNNTDSTLNIVILSRSWNSGDRVNVYTISPNAELTFTTKNIGLWNYDASKGVSLEFTNSSGGSFNGSITVSLPKIYTNNLSDYIGGIQDADWINFSSGEVDFEHGFYFYRNISDAASSVLHIIDRVIFNDNVYTGIEFHVYNDSSVDASNGTAWNESWQPRGYKISTLTANSWSAVFIPSYVWNDSNSMVSIYDLTAKIGGVAKIADFRLVKYAFGPESNQFITLESLSWAHANKIYNKDKGFAFNISTTSGSFVTEGLDQLDASKYKGYEFYVYNNSETDMSMFATADFSYNTMFGTLPSKVWTKCEIPASDVNRGNKQYFYPSLPNGSLIVTYFERILLDSIECETQYIDLNISTNGQLDTNKTVTLSIADVNGVSSVDKVVFDGAIISNSGTFKVSQFGYAFGPKKLYVDFTFKGITYVSQEYDVVLCSKLISSKTDLDSFLSIAESIADDESNLAYDGYFALRNDIAYNGEWNCGHGRNDYLAYGLQFNPNAGFRGTFDGSGYKIEGLVPSASQSGDWNGNSFIFKLAQSGVIKNVAFTNASLVSSGGYVTTIGEGTINDVYVSYSNTFSYCDGLGTFFYYDRSNDLGSPDTSYKYSSPMTITNCYVDASNLNYGSVTEANIHALGSKKYGKVSFRNVYAVVPSAIKEQALLTDFSNSGSFVANSEIELAKNKVIIDDININFTSLVFSRNDIVIPREYVDNSSSYFVSPGQSDYSIYLDDYLEQSAIDAASLLIGKVNEFAHAQIYVSINPLPQTKQNYAITISNDNTNALDYSVSVDSNKNASLTAHCFNGIRLAVLRFLNSTIGYQTMNYDYTFYSKSNTSNYTLTEFSNTYHMAASGATEGAYYPNDNAHDAGLIGLDDVWMNVIKEDDSTKSGHYHNLFYFISPEMYYSSHPDWFTPDMNQTGGYFKPQSNGIFNSNLCFAAHGNSSELNALKDVFYARLKSVILSNPNKNMICIGQHDNGIDYYCQCDACKSLSNPNTPILNFLNDLSSRIKSDSDINRDIYLYTMAYRATQNAPSDVTVDDHVGVFLAPINANYAYPLNDASNNSDARNMILGWKNICKNLAFYLYETNFIDFFSPFYNYEVAIQNNNFLNELNAKYVYYCSCVQNEHQSGFGEFRKYLTARSTTDVDATYSQIVNEFFATNGYYGPAGPTVKTYFEGLNNIMKDKKSSYSSIYNSEVMEVFSGTSIQNKLGDWKESLENARDSLDSNDPNYSLYVEHINIELLFIRYSKYISTWFSHKWYSGDSASKFISDCQSLGIYYIQEGVLLTEDSLDDHKITL